MILFKQLITIQLTPMKKFLLFPILFIAISVNAQISSYLSPPYPTYLTGSRNGSTIAWVFNDKGTRNVYTAAADGINVKRITNYSGDEGMDMSDVQITPGGEQIVYVRGNAQNNRGEAANPAFLQSSTEQAIYVTDKNGITARRISSGASPRISPDGNSLAFISGKQVWFASLADTSVKPYKLFQSRGNQNNIVWSPDGKAIAFVSNRSNHSFIGLYNFDNKAVNFVETSIDLDISPVWSPDGKQLAYIRMPNIHNLLPFTPIRESNPWSIRIYDVPTGKAKEVWKAVTGRGSRLFNDLPVGESLLWWDANRQLIFPNEKDGWVHLFALDLETGQSRLLTPGNGEVENVTLSNNRKIIYYTTNIGDIDRRHIWQLDLASGNTKQLTTGNAIEWSPVETSAGIAFFRSSAIRPAWPAVLHLNTIKDVAADLFPKDFPSDLVHPKAITITASDGIKSYAQLFLPPDYNAANKYPALVYMHGGSRRQMLLGFHYSQYYSNAYALHQFFARSGYIVLSLNYRSGIGYGLDFREALNYGAAGASEIKDVIAAGAYLQKRRDVLPNKVGLWGASYGGYLTAHGLSQAPHIFSAGVDIHGVHNWNDEIPTFAQWYDHAKFPEMTKKALQSSPIYLVKNWRAPVLLIHGDDDRNVPFSESVNIAEQLRRQNVHVEQLVLPDEVHSFLLYKSWINVLDSTYGFFDRQLKKR